MAYNKGLKLQDNIAAIHTVLRLQKGNRTANDDERAVLRKYSGFGGLKFILNPAGSRDDIQYWKTSDRPYFSQTRELFDIIHEYAADENDEREIIASIKRSVNTAFYTPAPVIDGIVAGLVDGKIKVSTMLDPSAGIGKFGDAFKAKNDGLKVTAFEKDLLTGRILKALNPKDAVFVDGFETISRGLQGSFDVVSSNIPFGDIAVFFRCMFLLKPSTRLVRAVLWCLSLQGVSWTVLRILMYVVRCLVKPISLLPSVCQTACSGMKPEQRSAPI